MLDQAADGVEAEVAQPGVAVAGEERFVALPERQVRVHARAVVAEERLGHEGRGLAGVAGDVADDVPRRHDLVGALHQVLGLRSISHWPPVATSWKWADGGDAALGHALGHLGPQVDQAVGGRAGEVAQARAGLVAEVGMLDPAPVPGPFGRVDVVERLGLALVEPDVVEDEELELRQRAGTRSASPVLRM